MLNFFCGLFVGALLLLIAQWLLVLCMDRNYHQRREVTKEEMDEYWERYLANTHEQVFDDSIWTKPMEDLRKISLEDNRPPAAYRYEN
jgi:hypothetical protein